MIVSDTSVPSPFDCGGWYWERCEDPFHPAALPAPYRDTESNHPRRNGWMLIDHHEQPIGWIADGPMPEQRRGDVEFIPGPNGHLCAFLTAGPGAECLHPIQANRGMRMRIHTDHNGVAVNAISRLGDGTDVDGHQYDVLAGSHSTTIEFQRGAVQQNGVNGLTNEALLSILIHRTKHLDGKFPCDENKRAIHHMEDALSNLEVRTARRMLRGVEGLEVQ